MTIYQVQAFIYGIFEIEVKSFGKKYVLFLNGQRETISSIKENSNQYFRTLEEAEEWIIRRVNSQIKHHEQQLKFYERVKVGLDDGVIVEKIDYEQD